MPPPAISRCFPSLDALVTEVTTDLYEELTQAVQAARDACPADEPLRRLGEMARGFRAWSKAHPAEFALMFGSPVPGVTVYAAHCDTLEAGQDFGAAFLDAMAELYAQQPFATPPAGVLDEFTDKLGPYVDAHGDRFPPAVVYVFLAAWTRLYGLVAMEVFGHLQWAMTDVEPLFELELARFVAGLTEPS